MNHKLAVLTQALPPVSPFDAFPLSLSEIQIHAFEKKQLDAGFLGLPLQQRPVYCFQKVLFLFERSIHAPLKEGSISLSPSQHCSEAKLHNTYSINFSFFPRQECTDKHNSSEKMWNMVLMNIFKYIFQCFFKFNAMR